MPSLLQGIFAGHIVYDHSDGQYFYFNGLHWKPDAGGNVHQIASDIATKLYLRCSVDQFTHATTLEMSAQEAQEESLAELKKGISKAKKLSGLAKGRALALSKYRNVENAMKFARATLHLGVNGCEWDSQLRLLGVQNAVIDLETGQPVQPAPEQWIRTVAPVPYIAGAKCRLWEKTVNEITDGDTEKQAYIKRVLGYAMTGKANESDFIVWYGEHGRNGKELILTTIASVLGNKLASATESALLLKSKSARGANSSTEALMTLRGRRLTWASETNEGQQMDLAAMKDLSGGHIMTGRHNHGKQVEWKRTHTIFLLTNSLPHVNSQKLAEWDRIKVLPFTVSFVDNPKRDYERKADRDLEAKLAGEKSGILNWLIQGAIEWRKGGLQTPQCINDATEQYKGNEDTLGRFIEDCCDTDLDANGNVRECLQGKLYIAYKNWADDDGIKNPLGRNTFLRKIEERGLNRVMKGKREYYFQGINVMEGLRI